MPNDIEKEMSEYQAMISQCEENSNDTETSIKERVSENIIIIKKAPGQI